jgi:hypothetical protein
MSNGPERQPQQQQQRALARGFCPACRQPARLVGRESIPNRSGNLLTFQCDCGQLFTGTEGTGPIWSTLQ